ATSPNSHSGVQAAVPMMFFLFPLCHPILVVRIGKPDFLILVKLDVLNKVPGFQIAITNNYKSTHDGKS
ncbi:MAG: hypothetical protein OSA23_05590, partial [Rhodospirillales bacterium]|nr:hypothetical protein [Rhodospirillales bacterium]